MTREVADLYTKLWVEVSKNRGSFLPVNDCSLIVARLPFPLGPSREGLPNVIPEEPEVEAVARARAMLDTLPLKLDAQGGVNFNGLLQASLIFVLLALAIFVLLFFNCFICCL